MGKYYFESVSNLLLRNPSVEKQFKHKKICVFLYPRVLVNSCGCIIDEYLSSLRTQGSLSS